MLTGLLDLDRFTSILAPGHLVVIGSHPEGGKTSLALSIAEHVAIRQGYPVGIFSLNDTDRDVASRILAAEALVPLEAVMSGRLSHSQEQALLETRRKLQTVPLYISAIRQLEIEQLVSDTTAAWEVGQLDLLIVDHVQSLRDFRRDYESKDEEFAAIVRSLKHLARELDIPIIAVSQTDEGRVHSKPNAADLKGATPLLEHSDLILLVHMPMGGTAYSDGFDGVAEILVAKDRWGSDTCVQTVFLRELATFRNLDLGSGSFPR